MVELQNPIIFHEKDHSWIGNYLEAKTAKEAGAQRFTRLENSCPICLGDLSPEDRMRVLPCSHSMHEKCFKDWKQETCPLDRSFVKRIERITFLGKEIIVPPKANDFAVSLSKKVDEEFIEIFQRSAIETIDKYSVRSEEGVDEFSSLGKIVGQDVFDLIEQDFSDEQIFEKARKAVAQVPQLKLEAVNEKKVKLDIIEGFFRLILLNPKDNPIFPLMKIFFEKNGLVLKEKEVERIFKYAAKFFVEMVTAVKENLYIHHFKEIRALPTQEEKKAYLQKLSKNSLKSLIKAAQGGGPTSKAIQKIGKEILGIQNEWGYPVAFAICCGFLVLLRNSLDLE